MLVVIVLLLAAGCDGDGGVSTTTMERETTAATTTTLPAPECDEVFDEAVDVVKDLVRVLDEVGYEVLVERSTWPEDLLRIEERGLALEERAAAAGCDPGALQSAVKAAADHLEAGGPLGTLLLEMLAP
jgi:hypothetical protein